MDGSSVVLGITYALVVAIENYNKPDYFKKVDYAGKDAKDFSDALKERGVDSDNTTILLNEKATKTSILAELKAISSKTQKYDRIIVYFAGHGVYFDGNNHIVPVDAYKTNLQDTCIPISEILGYLKKSASKQNLLFLDCCHSGFEPGDLIRDADATFLTDELKCKYRNEEYCIGFASCKSDQVSISHPKLKHGVWSHFLLKAINGKAGKIYEKGMLFNDKLQSYLNKEVAHFVKMNTPKKMDQTPIVFGNHSDRFMIADLNNYFDEQDKKKKVSRISLSNVTLLSEEEGEVKSLPDFIKGYHHVPNRFSPVDSFIKKCGSPIIKNEIEELGEQIQNGMSYKRKQFDVNIENGLGVIGTPDFTYSMEILQSNENPGEYILLRKLEGFENSQSILEEALNNIFSKHFNKLEFELLQRINVEEIIDTIDELEDNDDVCVKYSPSDTSICTISIANLDTDIEVTADRLSISSTFLTSPIKLINSYRKTHKAILDISALKFLND